VYRPLATSFLYRKRSSEAVYKAVSNGSVRPDNEPARLIATLSCHSVSTQNKINKMDPFHRSNSSGLLFPRVCLPQLRYFFEQTFRILCTYGKNGSQMRAWALRLDNSPSSLGHLILTASCEEDSFRDHSPEPIPWTWGHCGSQGNQ
jgi:hypothetical protein